MKTDERTKAVYNKVSSDERSKPQSASKSPDECIPKHKRIYKTSIQKWSPVGDDKIECPRCHSLKRPTVKTQTEHVSNSSFFSSLLMTCWPCCLSSVFLFPAPSRENLHCAICNYHYGIYDHKLKRILNTR